MAKTQSIYPIKTLRVQGASLQDAMEQVLEEGKPKQVHKLRTSVRRLEAQLELLSRVRELPEHEALAGKVRRCLRKLRRGAGAVRDCDVQLELIEAHLGADTRPELDDEGKKLRKRLGDERDLNLDELLTLVKRQRSKFARRMEALLEALAPSEGLSLEPGEMMTTLRGWVDERVGGGGDADEDKQEDNLHDIRKTAKLARYIAETAPKSATDLRRLGESYEALQQSGGTWHDWLTLWRIAKRHLGKRAPLTRHFQSEHEASLLAYQEALKHSGMKG